MRGFRFLLLAAACVAGLGFALVSRAQAQSAAVEKTQLYNSNSTAQSTPGLSGLLGGMKDRQPYKMQTMTVKKSYEELMDEAQKVNAINAEKQFQLNRAERKSRFAEMRAAYEADRAQKQAARAALREQKLGQNPGQKPGVVSPVSVPGTSGVVPGEPPKIRVYVPKKKDDPEKPRRLFNVREQ